MEFMILLGYVLNKPFLHRSLRSHHGGRIVVVEHGGKLAGADLGDEELGGLILAELEDARGGRVGLADPAEPPLMSVQPRKGADPAILDRGRFVSAAG